MIRIYGKKSIGLAYACVPPTYAWGDVCRTAIATSLTAQSSDAVMRASVGLGTDVCVCVCVCVYLQMLLAD